MMAQVQAQTSLSMARVRPELRWTDVHAQLLREKMERDQLVLDVVSRVHCLSKAQMVELMGMSSKTRFYSEPIKYNTGMRVWRSLGGEPDALPAPPVALEELEANKMPTVPSNTLESPEATPELATASEEVLHAVTVSLDSQRNRLLTEIHTPQQPLSAAYKVPTALRWLGWSVALLFAVLCNVLLLLSWQTHLN